jgi:hypothetical protein
MADSGLCSLPWVRDALALPCVETILDTANAEVRIEQKEGRLAVVQRVELFFFSMTAARRLDPPLDLDLDPLRSSSLLRQTPKTTPPR